MDKNFHLHIYTPRRIFFDGKVQMVVVNTKEGKIGVMADHLPMTVAIDTGIAKIQQDDKERELVLTEGFMTVNKNEVVILADSAEWPEELDLQRCKDALERADARLNDKETSSVELTRSERAVKRAKARIDILNKSEEK